MAFATVKTSNALGNSPLVKQSQRFVAHAFFGTILKQMHESPWRSEMFSGGKAGRNFESLLDDRLADRMASNSTSNKLVQSIVKKLEKKAGRNPVGSDNSPTRIGRDGSPSRPSGVIGRDGSPSRPSGVENGGFGETAPPNAGEIAPPNAADTTLSSVNSSKLPDPVDTVLAGVAQHLQFLSQVPRIDLKG